MTKQNLAAGLCFITLGIVFSVVFRNSTLGVIAGLVFVICGAVLTFMNFRKKKK